MIFFFIIINLLRITIPFHPMKTYEGFNYIIYIYKKKKKKKKTKIVYRLSNIFIIYSEINYKNYVYGMYNN